MRAGIRKRLAQLSLSLKRPDGRLFIMRTVPPFNFWDVTGLQVRTATESFIIEREGDRYDFETLQVLEDQAKARYTTSEPPKGFNVVSMRYLIDDGVQRCTQYNYGGTIPDNLRNTHLTNLYSY